MKIYSVLDEKSGDFGSVVCYVNDEVAKRAFSIMCRDKSTLYGLAPQDFDLFCLGEFVTSSGELIAYSHNQNDENSTYIVVSGGSYVD